jgi:hypothetical protein
VLGETCLCPNTASQGRSPLHQFPAALQLIKFHDQHVEKLCATRNRLKQGRCRNRKRKKKDQRSPRQPSPALVFNFEHVDSEPNDSEPIDFLHSESIEEKIKKVLFVGIRQPRVLRPTDDILQSAAGLLSEQLVDKRDKACRSSAVALVTGKWGAGGFYGAALACPNIPMPQSLHRALGMAQISCHAPLFSVNPGKPSHFNGFHTK